MFAESKAAIAQVFMIVHHHSIQSVNYCFYLLYPLYSTEIAKVMGAAIHFNTFGGNALGSAVGIAVLDVCRQHQLNTVDVSSK